MTILATDGFGRSANRWALRRFSEVDRQHIAFAAFHAADLGRAVMLFDPRPALDGACLNVGCIPSNGLLHIGRVIDEAESARAHGVCPGPLEIDLRKIRTSKTSVVDRLTTGPTWLQQQRNIRAILGQNQLCRPQQPVWRHRRRNTQNQLRSGDQFDRLGTGGPALPARGSSDLRIIYSTGAVELADIPDRLMVFGDAANHSRR